ncbi:MAG: hypothetical protein IJU70_06830 [Lentisphaeria bacterium]|nr:hypothetical protein [Lentisphaeria bacterium]
MKFGIATHMPETVQTYENIKPGDVTCVGVFQRDSDQARENAQIVRRVLG